MDVLLLVGFLTGAGLIVAGAELFAAHLSRAAARLGTSTFALGILLAGTEPEELATVVFASARDAPGIALGDVVGANVALSLVAVGVAALVTPLRFDRRLYVYSLAGVPLGVLAVALVWDGRVDRASGALLISLYAAYVTFVWRADRGVPALGEVGELAEARAELPRGRIGSELLLAITGVALLAGGSVLIVESVRELAGVQATEVRLGLTLVGFATTFELVVLAWSAARRRTVETAMAGVVGSFAYNATMTLGAGAFVRPLQLDEASALRGPLALMPVAFLIPIALALAGSGIGRYHGLALIVLYGLFVLYVFAR
ncbi:MAG: hypothetical protein Kow0010_05700 [Dehalococcoidia bacterium]